jgi:hypothetical protein
MNFVDLSLEGWNLTMMGDKAELVENYNNSILQVSPIIVDLLEIHYFTQHPISSYGLDIQHVNPTLISINFIKSSSIYPFCNSNT